MPNLAGLLDLIFVLFATFLSFCLRQNFEVQWNDHNMMTYLVITGFTSLIVLRIFKISRSLILYSDTKDYVRVAYAAGLIVVLTMIGGFVVFRLDGVARSMPILQFLLICTTLIGFRIALRHRRQHQSKRQVFDETVPIVLERPSELVVGVNALASLYIQFSRENSATHERIAGVLSASKEMVGKTIQGAKIIAAVDDLPVVLRNLANQGVPVTRLIVTDSSSELQAALEETVAGLAFASQVRIVQLYNNLVQLQEMSDHTVQERAALATHPMILTGCLDKQYWNFKRGFDIVGALVALTVLAPLFVVVAALVYLDLGGTIIFWQRRPGQFGRPLKLCKFRTMRPSHDNSGHPIPESARLSRIGTFLRRTRLDELPQLVHILRGDMSFIGPRPLLPVDQMGGCAGRLLVRPGLTGWAQVHGGRLVSPTDKVALDLWYIRNVSLAVELMTIVRTVKMVLFGERMHSESIAQAITELDRLTGVMPSLITTDNTFA